MTKDRFDSLINQVYQEYWNSIPTKGDRTYYHKEGFITKIKEDPEFSKQWDLKIEEHTLTYQERYRYWFVNNFETGMEFLPEVKPDFTNEYYDSTPTKLIKVTRNNNIFEYYV